jgi:hypothetical protein
MKNDIPRPAKTFERTVAPLPRLTPAAPAPPSSGEPGLPAGATPAFLTDKEIIQRLVEVLKNL